MVRRRRISRPERQLVALNEARERTILKIPIPVGETGHIDHLFAAGLDLFRISYAGGLLSTFMLTFLHRQDWSM